MCKCVCSKPEATRPTATITVTNVKELGRHCRRSDPGMTRPARALNQYRTQANAHTNTQTKLYRRSIYIENKGELKYLLDILFWTHSPIFLSCLCFSHWHTNLFPVASADWQSVGPVSCPLRVSEQPGSQASWVRVCMKHNPKQTPKVRHKPVHVSNRFSPVSNTPTEKTTLIIGYSTARNVTLENPSAIVRHIFGDRAATLNPFKTAD